MNQQMSLPPQCPINAVDANTLKHTHVHGKHRGSFSQPVRKNPHDICGIKQDGAVCNKMLNEVYFWVTTESSQRRGGEHLFSCLMTHIQNQIFIDLLSTDPSAHTLSTSSSTCRNKKYFCFFKVTCFKHRPVYHRETTSKTTQETL